MRMVRLSGILTYAAAESSLRGETGTVGLEETVEKTILVGAVTQ